MKKKVLIAVTSHGELGKTGDPTGWHCAEVSHPLKRFRDADLVVDFVSPTGGEAPMDPGSEDNDDPVNRAFMDNADDQYALNHTLSPGQVDPEEYGAIFFAGGHGTMWDFPEATQLQSVTTKIYEKGGIVGAVCHGPAIFVNLKLDDGQYLVNGKNVACFSNEEERKVGKTDVVPFLLADKLEEEGAEHVFAEPFETCVEVSERLVTGQNPASADGVAEEMIRLLKAAA
ncbi:type 1 glutamine amidotransferase domain-containing protein [Marinobacteraceae bacterium S3BR75-40.1]